MRRSFFYTALSAAALLGQGACANGLDGTSETLATQGEGLHHGHGGHHHGHGGHSGHGGHHGHGGHDGHGGHETSSSGSGHTTSTTGAGTSTSGGTTASATTSTSSGAGATTSTGVGATSSSTGSGSSSGSSSSSGAPPGGGGGGIFQASNPWNQPVDSHPKSASSDAIVNWLASNGGWGTGSMRIDFSIGLLTASASTPFRTFNPTSDFYSPDCDHVPFPVPAGGAIEGESGYACTQNGDCHLLVVHPQSNKLYEMWRADINGGTFNGGCAAVWDLTKTYPPNLRGDGCSSADAGGFPIAAMLFTADEVYAQHIPHAIRFILPNNRIRQGVYVHPGTHTTSPTSGGPNAPPYGVRFRLRAGFPLASLPSNGARVVAQAMQKYGMFLADGGNIALTAADDRFTQHKWTDVVVDAHSLSAIQPTDMEVVDMGTPVSIWNCTRNP